MSEPGQRTELPLGVQRRPLVVQRDARGSFSEIYRAEWGVGLDPVQWSVSTSHAGTLRGMRVHPRHDDYLVVVQGRTSIGLCDLRPGSPTEHRSALVELCGRDPTGLFIPHGVGHGFYFHEASIYMLGVSSYFDETDELGFHWADPVLEIHWPVTSPMLSERDAALRPLSAIEGLIPPWRP
jgi:dTDP-4-dehydrorhamnose 3,5-epimerase